MAKPIRPRRLPNEAYRDEEFLVEDDVLAVAKAAGSFGRHGDRDRAMIILAFHHGLRCTETVKLKWERINMEREDLWVFRVKGSLSGRHPFIPGDAAALLKLHPAESGWVFKSEPERDSGHVSESGFQKIVERAGERAKLKYPIHPHMLRHSCGFWLRKQGHEIMDIRDWLGHKSVKNTERYAKAGPDRFREIGIGRITGGRS